MKSKGKSLRGPLFKKPAPVKQPNSKPTVQKGPGVGESMKQGFGLGVGLEGARAAVGAVAGVFSGNDEPLPNQDSLPNQQKENNEFCQFEKHLLKNCLKENNSSLSECDDYFKVFERCKANSEETIDSLLM
tara:strand:- start:726 stop:1118 length:393 start_codon:yes stop_codon:yes gene_type:complete